jgi:glucose dehydrogenase
MNAVVALFPRWFRPLIFGLILVTSACSSPNASRQATSSRSAERAADQPGGMRSSSEWPAYNGGYDATRFSPVAQISAGKVASLTEVARFKLPETTAFQSGPVLIDGTMYVTTATNTYGARRSDS